MVYNRVPDVYKNSNTLLLLVLVILSSCLIPVVVGAMGAAASYVSPGAGSLVTILLMFVACFATLLLNGYFISRLVGGLPQGEIVTCTARQRVASGNTAMNTAANTYGYE
jgi:hypothetical protein